MRGEFIVNSLSEDTTYLEFNVYDMTGNTLATITGTDSTPVLQTSGNWGISAYDRSSFDDFSLYSGNEDTLVVPPLAADFVFSGHKKTIKI
ncbi:MAG: hypothetical protein LBG52_07995 [Candidatus Peribacteria bacterium]|nr:hypothetical protein [Candidatus Peribacteria bacterium]